MDPNDRDQQAATAGWSRWLCSAAALLALSLCLSPIRVLLAKADRLLLDHWHVQATPMPADPRLVVLGLDDASLTLSSLWPEDIAANPSLQVMQKGFPWPRRVWAEAIDRLAEAGATAIFLDFAFVSPATDPADDAALAAALTRHPKLVVLGAKYDFTRQGEQDAVTLILPASSLGTSKPQVGLLNFIADTDGTIRSIRPELQASEFEAITLGHEIASNDAGWPIVAQLLKERINPTQAPESSISRHRLRFGPLDAYAPRPIYEIFVPDMWQKNYANGAFFKGKAVLIGAAAQQFQDFQRTTVGSMLGVQLHAHATAALSGKHFVTAAPPSLLLWLAGLGVVLAWLLTRLVRQPLVCLASQWGLSTAAVLGSFYLFQGKSVEFSPLSFVISLNVCGLAALAGRLVTERREFLQVRRYLARYTSPALVNELLRDRQSLFHTLKGQERIVTILFSDVRGFTSFSEGRTPTEVVTQLNEYLSAMVPCVFQRKGMVDKFIGDAVMALWGNLHTEGLAKDAQAALQAALAMRVALVKLNKAWTARGWPNLAIGIGIHQGPCVVGNMGSAAPYEKMDPTVIGDSVNLASRLEGLTKDYACDIIISDSVFQHLGPEAPCTPLGDATVKGKALATAIYKVL